MTPIRAEGRAPSHYERERREIESNRSAESDQAINFPALSRLRNAVANVSPRELPRPAAFRRDLLAGLNSTIGSAPDGLANGVLAGVTRVYGLYATATLGESRAEAVAEARTWLVGLDAKGDPERHEGGEREP